MNVFITGVSGFSGSHVARHLLENGHRVTALSRHPALQPPLGQFADRLSLMQGDLASLRALPAGIEAIVHAAATSPSPTSTTRNFIRDNALGTENLVALAREREVKKFLFFSSMSVHGRIAQPVADENTPIVNPDAYGASKLLGEICLRESVADFSSIALRLPAVIGPGASRHWLAAMLERARTGKPMDIYNPDAQFNNAVHIADLCVFIEKWLGRELKGFDAVPLGANGAMTIRDIVSRILSATRSASEVVVHSLARQSFTVSSRRAEQMHGYVPADFRTILDRYLAESLA